MEAAGPALPGETVPAGEPWGCWPRSASVVGLVGGGPPALSGPFPWVTWPYWCHLAPSDLGLGILREGAEGARQEGRSSQVVIGRGGLGDTLT